MTQLTIILLHSDLRQSLFLSCLKVFQQQAANPAYSAVQVPAVAILYLRHTELLSFRDPQQRSLRILSCVPLENVDTVSAFQATRLPPMKLDRQRELVR